MKILSFFQWLANLLFFRKIRANRCFEKFLSCIQDEMKDEFLDILLKLMGLVICLDHSFKKNIENFKAVYVFTDKPAKMYIVAIFENNQLKVKKRKVNNPDITLTFKDGAALFNLLLSEAPNILDAVLNQEVDFYGNLNYLNKFAYMAMHLKLMVMEKVEL